MSRARSEYAVIGLFDRDHRLKIGFSGLLCGGVLVVVLAPLFTDLFETLALRSPSKQMREWGPLVVGIASALLVTFAGIAAGTPSANPTRWWQDRKVRVTTMLVGLGMAIALARFSKGVTTIQQQRLAAVERARVDVEAARKILTESDEAKSILLSIKKADDLVSLGTRRRFPKIRQHGFRLRAEAREAQSELKRTAREAIAEAEARLRALPSPHDIPTEEVLRVIAGPALTELVFAELGAVVMAFWASIAGAPIRRRRWSEIESEQAARRLENDSKSRLPLEPTIRDEDIEDVEFEEPIVDIDRTSERHPNLRGVDYQNLDGRTLEGLDEQRGEWHTLPLRRPALRRVGNRRVLWPVIDVDDGPGGRIVFAGSRDAFALVPQRIIDHLAVSPTSPDQVAPQNADTSLPVENWIWTKKDDEEPN